MSRKVLSEMFPLEIVNQIKVDSNDLEATHGVDLVNKVETGEILVIGCTFEGDLLYRAANLCKF